MRDNDNEVTLSAMPESGELPIIESDSDGDFESLEEESFTSLKTLKSNSNSIRNSTASSLLTIESVKPQQRKQADCKLPTPRFRKKKQKRPFIEPNDVVVTSDPGGSWEIIDTSANDKIDRRMKTPLITTTDDNTSQNRRLQTPSSSPTRRLQTPSDGMKPLAVLSCVDVNVPQKKMLSRKKKHPIPADPAKPVVRLHIPSKYPSAYKTTSCSRAPFR